MIHLSKQELTYRLDILAHLRHIQDTMLGGGSVSKSAVEQLVREIGFTHLNRLCAYKILESRKLIREAVGRGLKSNGFKFYLADHPEDERRWSGGKQEIAYGHFLEWLGRTLSVEIGTLFSPHDPANLLFPPHRVVEQILDLLNSDELRSVWLEDEAIGWVYQYYTPKELRDTARKESVYPRNSYELAFRNQFYTPRYVVQFLVDNTLARTWYEMRQGHTRLVDQCKYIVRRSRAVFMAELEKEPPVFEPPDNWTHIDAVNQMWTRPNPELRSISDIWKYALTVDGYNYASTHLARDCGELANERMHLFSKTKSWEGTFEELRCCLFFEQRRYRHFGYDPEGDSLGAINALHQATCRRWDLETEYIVHRRKKDPREISALDPACGSGHFLLYCFDVFATMYEEAYDDPDLGQALQRDYPDRGAFQAAIPGLILRHNLHGIDIDRRSSQIAALALWLRAQRSYQEMGLGSQDRPRITRANIVCAEPMPGELELLDEFVSGLHPRVLGQLVRVVFEKMALAGEAGSLLKIEDEMRTAIGEARRQWKTVSKTEQLLLWAETRRPRADQLTLFDVTGITDETFWDEAESRLLEHLETYASRATAGAAYLRRLFSEDAARGFAFVDLCRKRFDVVLMNPPFGGASIASRSYVNSIFPRSGNDVFAAFVERGLGWLEQQGYLGAITSRTGFFLSSFKNWRQEILVEDARPTVVADLGYGVLDTAMVETAAYCLERGQGGGGSMKTAVVLASPPLATKATP